MKTSVVPWFLALLLWQGAAGSLQAGPRASFNYSIPADTADGGGRRATSAAYTNDASAGAVVGISTAASIVERANHGYISQLTEVAAFVVTATPRTVPQAGTSQLTGAPTFDDGTTAVLAGSDITWSAVAYPFQSLSGAGLLTAVANVYAAPAGTVAGSYRGTGGTTTVTVTGPYAGASIPDSWFAQYFGPAPNPLAAPGADADGTGQSNLFKYLAGLNPRDGSRFVLTISSQNTPNQKNLSFGPIVAGGTYTVVYKTSLTSPAWSTLAFTSQSDNGTTRTVVDAAPGAPKFYAVQISRP